MAAPSRKIVNAPQTARPAAAATVFARAAVGIQPASALKVSSPTDAAEVEAESTARKVVRMAAPERAPSVFRSPHAARLQRASDLVHHASVPAATASDIGSRAPSGSPLPPDVRRFMEPRFGADFGSVRVHTDEGAARLDRRLSAQAFTVGNQVFFGRDRFQPETPEGRELIAHELTHTIQQGAAVQRAADVAVTEHAPESVQRLGVGDALDYFADKANYIPGFRMLTIILGINPINMSRVERTAANV